MVQSKSRKGGFTLIELLVVVSIIGLLIGILLPALSRAKKQAQQVKDSSQVREIHRGLVSFAQNNRDRYPTPAQYDKLNYTEPGGTPGTPANAAQLGQIQIQKNRTGAIMSIMIYTGTVTTEQCISPAEAEGQIRKDPDFRFGDINEAPDRTQALWDPGFVGSGAKNGDKFVANMGTDTSNPPDNPISGTVLVCNNSYAWQPHYGVRQGSAYWSTTYAANDPVMGNRGPLYAPTQQQQGNNNPFPLQPGPEGTTSTTLLIHGGKKTWEGNFVYNDGHVQSENSAAPANVRMSYQPGGTGPEQFIQDNLFYDELWEGNGSLTNAHSSRSNFFFRQWPQGFDLQSNTAVVPTDKATWDGRTGGGVGQWLSS